MTGVRIEKKYWSMADEECRIKEELMSKIEGYTGVIESINKLSTEDLERILTAIKINWR